MNKGKIITFYSYKGGVGRTMSLANIATILAQWGKKVLVIDWDLEAPGLERYFMNYVSNIKLGKKRGVIDLLIDKTSNTKVNWKRYLQDVNIANKYKLKYLGSGKKGSDYFDKLKQLDIDSLYEKNYGFEFFEGLRSEWKSEFDYILIDSRTGITDNGGICTIQMPDIVLVFTNTNEQSVLGTKEIIERINFTQQSQPFDRQNLIIFPILCRFDTTTEFEISQVWIKKVSDTLMNVYNDWLPLGIELKEFIEKTKIPYFPYFSFGEKLSVLEQGFSDPSSMGYAYESLTSLIVNNFQNIDNFINNRSSYISHAKKTYNLSSLIKVIGVGGGGSNAVTHMFKQVIQGVDFIICNTDAHALENCDIPTKILLGSKGLGAGSIPDVGREAAMENIEEIKQILEENTEMLFITTGMGGGTGTGAAPVIAATAKEMGLLTVGLVTIPFDFEGKKRRDQAEEGIKQLQKHVDTLMIINNNSLRELYGNLSLSETFGEADKILTIAIKGIVEIITVSGYINVDFEDLKIVMKDSGIATMGFGVAGGKGRAIKAIVTALSSPLFNNNNINGARDIILYISSGTKEELSMNEILDITDYIQDKRGSTAEIIWGTGIDESLGSSISVTIVATGFKEKTKATEIFDSFFSNTIDLETTKAQDELDEMPKKLESSIYFKERDERAILRINKLKEMSNKLEDSSIHFKELENLEPVLKRRVTQIEKKEENQCSKDAQEIKKIKSQKGKNS